jgi:hypothetical protein
MKAIENSSAIVSCFLSSGSVGRESGLVQHVPPRTTTIKTRSKDRNGRATGWAKLFARQCAPCRRMEEAAGAQGNGDLRGGARGVVWILPNGSLQRGMPSFAHLLSFSAGRSRPRPDLNWAGVFTGPLAVLSTGVRLNIQIAPCQYREDRSLNLPGRPPQAASIAAGRAAESSKMKPVLLCVGEARFRCVHLLLYLLAAVLVMRNQKGS